MIHLIKCVIIFIIFLFMLPSDHCKLNKNNAFILEYFLYRAPSTIVGFSCNSYESDFELVKNFSDVRLQSVIWKLEDKIEFSSFAKAEYRRLGIFIDLRCQLSENVKLAFNEAANYKMFDELYYWLVLGSSLNESLSLVNDNSFGLSTDFMVAVTEENQYSLYDVYNPCKSKGGRLKIKKVGVWNEINGLRIPRELNKLLRWNLQGMTLKISGLVKTKPPNMTVIDYLQDWNFKQYDRMTRLAYAMWIHVADMFNITLEFTERNVWNENDENGPVMNELIKGDIDASGSAEKMTSERVSLVKSVYPALPYRTCFIFRSTSSDRLSVRDIFLPLSSTVWYLTIAISVLSINALAFLTIFTKQDFYENYLRSIIIHVGAFCQQGTEFSSNNLSGRIAILHILLFNLLLYNYYLASAVSNRLSEPITLINDSLHELRQKDFEYASEPMLNFDQYIKVRQILQTLLPYACDLLFSNDWETRSFYTNRWIKIPESQRFIPPEKGMDLVLKGGFAYHTHPEISYPYIERYFDDRKICEIQEVHLIRPVHLSIFVHINSSFVEMFKSGFMRLSEVGIRYRQIQLWSARKPICRTDILTADSVTIKEVAPAIIFLLFSMLVAGTLLSLEFLFATYYKRAIRFGLRIKKELSTPQKKTVIDGYPYFPDPGKEN